MCAHFCRATFLFNPQFYLKKKTPHNITKELFVIVKKCNSKTRVVVLSTSYKIGKFVRGDEKEEKKKGLNSLVMRCELFIKPLQIIYEGFVCPLVMGWGYVTWE